MQGDYDIDDGSDKIGVYGSIVEMVSALKSNIDNAERESENAREQSRKAQEAMQQAETAGRQAQAKTEAMLVAADKLEQVAGVVSSASTNDVGNAIKAIQESTTKSMTGVYNAVERIGQATELASRSGQALQEIVATVEATADQVNAIATASEEQSAASEEINQSIVQVNDMSRQTAEAAKAVSDLAAQAQGLTGLIHDMKQG